MAEMKVRLVSEELGRLFATRVELCLARDCQNHSLNNDGATADCILKEVAVGEGGACLSYDPVEETAD